MTGLQPTWYKLVFNAMVFVWVSSASGCIDMALDDLSISTDVPDHCAGKPLSRCREGAVQECVSGIFYDRHDCDDLGFDCIEWEDDDGRKNAGCKVSDEKCPDDADGGMICVDECYHVACIPGRFPALGVYELSANCCDWSGDRRCFVSESPNACCKKTDSGQPTNCR